MSDSESFNSASDSERGEAAPTFDALSAPSLDMIMNQWRHETVESLQEKCKDLERENARLEDECEIFDQFIEMHRVPDRTVQAAPTDRNSRLIDRSRGKLKTVELKRLLGEHKTEVAIQVQYALTQRRQEERARKEHQIMEKKALLEEYERQLQDIHRYEVLFQRDVVDGGRNPIPGRGETIMSEKVQRFFRDVLYAQDNVVKKLLLKNSALKQQLLKLKVQVRTKQEMNEVLGHIDFGQLKIENRQHLSKIEEKNAELLRLKHTAGNAVLVLNRQKNDLVALIAESHKLHLDAEAKRVMVSKVKEEAENIQIEIEELTAVNTKLKTQQDEFVVPSVLSYVQSTEAQFLLSRRVADWQRKVEIAEMALKRQKRALLQLEREQGL
eukprot:c17790_g1_i1.p1 GENE.c17790_g1_i1~~c17790_g1_i1.p1  ORF type:complete len:384 (+),score=109.68 c17790_g1_i1:96-1247(+)